MAGARCPMLRSKEREREREKEKRKRKERLPRREETSEDHFRIFLRGVLLKSHTKAIAKEEQNTRVGPTDNFEQSKEKN